MTALWCLLGHALVKNRLLGDRISRYGHIVLPLVLIALGLHILWGARVLVGWPTLEMSSIFRSSKPSQDSPPVRPFHADDHPFAVVHSVDTFQHAFSSGSRFGGKWGTQ